MVDTYAAGDRVEVRYPTDDSAPRDDWPWLPATVLGTTDARGEWEVELDQDEADVQPQGIAEAEPVTCFRGASEIRRSGVSYPVCPLIREDDQA